MASLAVGVDVGGTKLVAGLVAADGSVLGHVRVPTPARSDVIPELVAQTAMDLAQGQGLDHLPVGVGAAGLIDPDGVVRYAPNIDWADFPLRDRVQALLDVPVTVGNDANVAAWGEYRCGAGAEAPSSMVMLTVGTGVGGGLVIGDSLVGGNSGLAAEFGHIIVNEGGPRCGCGNLGCLEAVASGTAIGRRAREAFAAGRIGADSGLAGLLPEELTGKRVTVAAHAGDPLAAKILAGCGTWLGVGIASLVNALDPEIVVMGGGAMEAGDLLLSPARAAALERMIGRKHRRVPPIVRAQLGDQAGLVGAALLAMAAA